MAKISYIIPCYFNEDNIPVTSETLFELESSFPLGTSFEYVFVDDGSKDKTFEHLKKLHTAHSHKVTTVRLSRNFGSFNAILAGMNYCTGDCSVFIAADLQDPPELVPKMFDYWKSGIKLVIANRNEREESWTQRIFSNFFHFTMKRFALKNVPTGGFDLILFDRDIREKIIEIDEKNTNILYLMTWLGFDYVNIPYKRRKREIGSSKWTLSKKIKMFIDSFVAFSFLPLRIISFTGLTLGFFAFLYAMYLIYLRIANETSVEGWTALMVVFLFVSTFQMISLGIIGEYLWRNLDAVRGRPNFVVSEFYTAKESNKTSND